MQLSVTTYDIFKSWDLDTLCAELPKAGVKGVEFRIDGRHKHGVELSASRPERAAMRKKLRDAGLCCCSIATGFCFHGPDPKQIVENVEGTWKAMELARDMGAPRVRVFGNVIPENSDPDAVAIRVGSALRSLAPGAGQQGVDLLLEMHGDFNDWRLNKMAVGFANHRAVGVVYNCDSRDRVNGSVATVFHEMKALIRHVHFHDLKDAEYPYAELFRLLSLDGYGGFMSMEVSMEGDPVRNLAEQAEIFFRLKKEGMNP